MITVNEVEYVTKEEAAARCKAFAKATPGATFHNFAHCKVVRRMANDAERAAKPYYLEVDLYEWNKVYTDDPILVSHPEVRGLWRERRK